MDPLQRKQNEERRLDKAITDKQLELSALITELNNAKKKAKDAIKKIDEEMEKAQNEFLQYLESLGLAYKKGDQMVVTRRKRG